MRKDEHVPTHFIKVPGIFGELKQNFSLEIHNDCTTGGSERSRPASAATFSGEHVEVSGDMNAEYRH